MKKMKSLIKQIHNQLIRKRKTVAVAESCTGGLTSNLLTTLSGSSRCFLLGTITYSNQMKIKVLKIPAALIKKKGAVSREVAIKMSQGVRELANSDFSIGITGIAGPSGGSTAKPIGTVFISIDSADKTRCERFRFSGNRTIIRQKAARKALELLSEILGA